MSPIDFNGLDTAVHGPIRLGVLTALQMDDTLDFTTLKKRLNAVDGSLGMHLKRLEKVGYISSRKVFIGRRPNTSYRLTRAGRKALECYLNTMEQLLNALAKAKGSAAP